MLKMKTLKQKLLTPMILLVVLVPIATLLFFNVAMQIYVQKEARNDLKEAMLPIETLAQQEFQGSSGSLSSSGLQISAAKLKTAMRETKLTDAGLLIFNAKEKLTYPQNVPEGFISENLAQKIAGRLNTSGFGERVEQIRVGKTTYLMFGYVLNGNADKHIFIVLVSQLTKSTALIRIIDFILLTIMLIGIFLGVFIVSRITKRTSRQVEQICAATENISRGDFTHPLWEKTNIAEFNRLSESITDMSSRLEAAERSQRDFLQNASHELRTPLMSIQGYAEGISSGIVPDVKDAADIINSESRRLNTLVEELLTLSRIESGTLNRELQELNLCNLLPDFVQRLGGIAVKQQKTISLSLSAQTQTVMGNEELLGRAVTNIISNCLRYAKDKVGVSLLSLDGSVIIRIQDDGPGINCADLPHVFERFYKGNGGNFGLGLAIAKAAIQNIGGDIKAYNGEPGATFDIVLNSVTDYRAY